MSKLNKELIEDCYEWICDNGLMDFGGAKLKDFCRHFHIDQRTYYRWMGNAVFADTVKKGRKYFRENSENDVSVSLVKSAKGYDYEETRTEYQDVSGKPKVKKMTKITKHVQANVTAAIFFLTNVAPERWKNRQDVKQETTGEVKHKGLNIIVSDEETADLLRRLKDK